ncbi:MAG: hypothetical protein GTN89_06370, partial [Acidobacteria bacterium]|nr:hypothetical protein [Acidobacteriota bacterium]NIM61958.1 hypothetical protein [Acidobacteriota bacterium]NIO58324.1 hypothetical protein [Acidobacteriota bacterium]NIQ29987.1 hypothetical protein [Acidobacteriota bacterium]NIQ83989.1 hypothetical protein [Acidobacteriota bacterium]
ALLVGLADGAWANSARDAANRIHADWRDKGVQVWFQGHWGFQWYMQEQGHRPFDIRDPQVSPGDVLVLPTNNTNVRRLDPRLASELAPLDVRTHGWLSTMNLDVGAGCYSHLSAPLPFAFGAAGSERYIVLRAEQPIRGRPVRPSR